MNPIDAPKGIEPWGRMRLEDGEESELVLGPLTLRVTRAGGELRLATIRDGEYVTPGAWATGTPGGRGDGEEPEWSRWAVGGWDGDVFLEPMLPDRPLVVAPEDAFHLLAGAEARIYVRVPLWVKLEVGTGDGRSTLLTLPTIPASDTWWGTVEEGELSYWLTTHARRAVTEDLFERYLSMCPLQLQNRSEHNLTVDKVAVRGDYVSLYAQEGRIWSDEMRVRYQGDVEGSRLQMAGEPPREAPDAVPLAPARLRMGRGFRARTFARLLGMPGWTW